MPAFNIEVPHPLSKEDAKNKLENFMEQVRSKYQDQVSDLQENWDDHTLTFSFKTYGFSISGNLVVEDKKVAITGTLPFAALAFRGKIEQSIRGELEKQLA